MSVALALELRAMFSKEQLRELDAVSAAMRANPEALDNHNRQVPAEQKESGDGR